MEPFTSWLLPAHTLLVRLTPDGAAAVCPFSLCMCSFLLLGKYSTTDLWRITDGIWVVSTLVLLHMDTLANTHGCVPAGYASRNEMMGSQAYAYTLVSF